MRIGEPVGELKPNDSYVVPGHGVLGRLWILLSSGLDIECRFNRVGSEDETLDIATMPTMSDMSTASTFNPLREFEGRLVPVAGVWIIDRTHSSLAFEARHMVVTRMRGRFRGFSGEFHIAEQPGESWVEVSIEAASLDTTNSAADDSLKSDRFLDVERFPQLHYRSTTVRHVEADRWQIDGELTIKGVTRLDHA